VTPKKPRLLIVSNVKPFPGSAGQQMRVRNKLEAFRSLFKVSFLTVAEITEVNEARSKLSSWVDHPIVLPSVVRRNASARLRNKVASGIYVARTGLKASNHSIGHVELSPQRIAAYCNPLDYDLVVYEYWHTVRSTGLFQEHGVPCVLDMHDILWQSYQRQLNSRVLLPGWWRKWALERYKEQEELAWHRYDALIAINAEEARYARQVVGDVPIFYAPMGVDIEKWPYSWTPAEPRRLAYYGGLGNPYNQQEALRCYRSIMPKIWRERPEVELWLVGSNPPPSLQALPVQDSRVKVTGYVERVQDVLKSMYMVLCPFSATYGFRSRLIEAMALGVPVVATPAAVYGMDLQDGQGLCLRESDEELAQACLDCLDDSDLAQRQSRLARAQVEKKFSFDVTYGQLARDLYEFAMQFASRRQGSR